MSLQFYQIHEFLSFFSESLFTIFRFLPLLYTNSIPISLKQQGDLQVDINGRNYKQSFRQSLSYPKRFVNDLYPELYEKKQQHFQEKC